MKRTIALLLSISCIFSMYSCGDKKSSNKKVTSSSRVSSMGENTYSLDSLCEMEFLSFSYSSDFKESFTDSKESTFYINGNTVLSVFTSMVPYGMDVETNDEYVEAEYNYYIEKTDINPENLKIITNKNGIKLLRVDVEKLHNIAFLCFNDGYTTSFTFQHIDYMDDEIINNLMTDIINSISLTCNTVQGE